VEELEEVTEEVEAEEKEVELASIRTDSFSFLFSGTSFPATMAREIRIVN